MIRMPSALAALALALAASLFAGCDDYSSERGSASGDLDGADVAYAEAQNLISDGDPHGLDRDGDGEACERNR